MVRWESALPVREALVLTHAKEATDTEHSLPQPDKYYIIAVEGLIRGRSAVPAPNADADPDSLPNGGRAPVDINVVRQGLLNFSRLYPKDKKAILPATVRVDELTGTVRVYFPKDVPIEMNDREVIFQTTYGSIKVTQRFKLKDMQYGGKLEL
jgi:hypothetical protein